MALPVVKSLHVYPVKSCKGIDLQSAAALPTGFAFDRKWVIVREKNSKFQTQRQKPELALIETSLPQQVLDGTGTLTGDAALTLRAPGKDDFCVPLTSSTPRDRRNCKVWEWRGVAEDEGDAVAEWLSDFLGLSVRLLKYAGDGPDSQRSVDPAWGPGHQVAFPDGFPYLIANQASLDDLNGRIGGEEQIPMNRFRANIVVDDCGAWSEDTWKIIRINPKDGPPLQFELKKPCSRCKIPTIDQNTASVGKEPMMELMKFRTGKQLGWDDVLSPNDVFFAWNAVVGGAGRVSVGDAVNVMSTRENLVSAEAESEQTTQDDGSAT
ncbi:hypothetical protein BSKO_01819 [Bryopsis sp. KO-2023]|nr:hypothetical protein BSKO_01819 [Bryopsis sp. KO-2023]